MSDPVPAPAAPAAEAPAATVADQLPEIRKQLQLPETATEQDIIGALLGIVQAVTEKATELQAKYDEIVSQTAEQDVAVANRAAQEYSDVIAPEAVPFWTERLLCNRAETVAVLDGLRAALPPPAPGVPRREPLANRRPVAPPTIAVLATGRQHADPSAADAIRNRALALVRDQHLTYMRAFALAQTELSK